MRPPLGRGLISYYRDYYTAIMDELQESELERICLSIHSDLFRCGILLGIELYDIEEIILKSNETISNFIKCRRLIERWRATIDPKNERKELARVLQRLEYIKLAKSIDSSMENNASGSCHKVSEELALEDLDFVSFECSSSWETLALHTGLSQTEIDDIKGRQGANLYQKAYLALHRKSLMSCLKRSDLVATLREIGKGRIARKLSEGKY